MRKRYSRIAAATTAIVAAALAVLALQPSPKTAVTLAARNPVVEVRTVVIRRTIHIVKHEHAQTAAGRNGGAPVSHGTGTAPRTRTSAAHSSGSAAAGAISTHASGSHPVTASPGTAPVTTRTSRASGGSTGRSGSAAPVRTRTSTTSGSASGKPVSTRTSGAGGGGDGGDGNGRGDN